MTTATPTDGPETEIEPTSTASATTDRAILFDMDGVIVEGWGTDPSVHTRALEDALVSLDIDEELTRDDHIRTPLETYEYTDAFVTACETIGVDPGEFYAIREEFSAKRAIARLEAGERGLYSDVPALETLARETDLALVSNNYDPTVTFVVGHFDLEVFSFVRGRDVGLEGFERRKPDPYYLEEALGALDARDGLYVGDRETDLVAAESAGLEPVFIRREHNVNVEPALESYTEIGSLEELRTLL